MKNIQKHHEDSPGVCKNEAVDRIKTLIQEKMINPVQTPNSTNLLTIKTRGENSHFGIYYCYRKRHENLETCSGVDAPKEPNSHIKTFRTKRKKGKHY